MDGDMNSASDAATQAHLDEFSAAHARGDKPDIWSFLNRARTHPRYARSLIQEDIHGRIDKGENPWIDDYIEKDSWDHRQELLHAFRECLYADGGAIAKKLGVDHIGPYQTKDLLGFGGFGTVFLGREPGKDLVAIKVAHRRPSQAAHLLDKEAKALERLGKGKLAEFPGVPRFVQRGRLGRDRWFLASSYVQGSSLSAWLSSEPPRIQRLRIARQLVTIVAELHAAEIYHGDLAPSNVLIETKDSNPRAHLIDFASGGFGYVRHEFVAAITDAYAAPELISGDETQPDAASDTWSLGLLVHEVLTGKHPFGDFGPDLSVVDWQKHIGRGRPVFPLDGAYGDALPRVLVECLNPDPKIRLITNAQVLLRAIPEDATTNLADVPLASPVDRKAAEVETLRLAYLERVLRRFEGVRVPLVNPTAQERFIPIGSIVVDLPLSLEKEVEDRHERERLAALGYAERISDAEKKKSVQPRVIFGERLAKHQATALVGQPGCGKSTLLAWAICQLAADGLEKAGERRSPRPPSHGLAPRVITDGLLPVVIVCRDVLDVPKGFVIEDLLKRQLQHWGFSSSQGDAIAQMCMTRVSDGRAMLLVDGLDEMPYEKRLQLCRILNEHTTATKSKCVVTSRVTGFRRIQHELSAFDFLMIDPLTDAHRKTYAKLWSDLHPGVAVDVLQRQACENPRLARLCENMLMLALIVQIGAIERLLDSRRVDIFRRIVAIMVERQRQGEGSHLTMNELWPYLEVLAFQMRVAEVQHETESTVIEHFEKARRGEPARHTQSHRDPGILLEDILTRIDLLNISGTRLDDSTGLELRIIQFFHQSLQEYFAGQAIIHGRGGSKDKPLVHLRKLLGTEKSGALTVKERSIRSLAGGRHSEPVLAENWREAISMAIATLGDDASKGDAAMELLLPTPKTPEKEARARAVFAMRCLGDEPIVSEVVVRKVFDAALASLIQEDGFNNDANTQMDEAARSVWTSRFGTMFREFLLQAFMSHEGSHRQRIGAVYLTAGYSSAEESLSASNADRLLAWQVTDTAGRDAKEHVREFLRLTHLLYSVGGKAGTGSLQFLSLQNRDRLVLTTLQGIQHDHPAIRAAALWCLGWATKAKSARDEGGIRLKDHELATVLKCLDRSNLDEMSSMWACLIVSLREGDRLAFAEYDWIYNWAVVADGGKALREIPEPSRVHRPEAVTRLQKVLSASRHSRARRCAAVALGRLGVFPKAAVQPLVEFLADDLLMDSDRDEAIAYLVWNRSRKALDVLHQIANARHDGDNYLDGRGLLGLIGTKDIGAIAEQLEHGKEAAALAFALAGLDDPRARKRLESFTHHKNSTVRAAAEKAMKKAAEWDRSSSATTDRASKT